MALDVSEVSAIQASTNELTELLNQCVLWLYNLAIDPVTKHEVQKLNLFATLASVAEAFGHLQAQWQLAQLLKNTGDLLQLILQDSHKYKRKQIKNSNIAGPIQRYFVLTVQQSCTLI